MNKSKEARFFINAVNIHKGGGLVLLSDILDDIPEYVDSTVLVDARLSCEFKLKKNIIYKYIKPTIFSRLLSEFWLLKTINSEDLLLSFGNLPPLFNLPSRTILFLQNRYLVDIVSLKNFSFRARVRIFIERLWFKFFLANVSEVVVQTSSMRKLIESKAKIPVRVFPFRKKITKISEVGLNNKLYDFIYVASFEPHKNHKLLIEAWHLLAQENIFPSLLLTLGEDDFKFLSDVIYENKILYQLNIRNIKEISHLALIDAYQSSSALIYPSLFESLGLPLLEAKELGLSVVASELDFVRDLIEPDETFDPNSALSIARAVKRYLRVVNELQLVESPSNFISYVLRLR